MVFNKKERAILNEWVLDFKSSVNPDNPLIIPLEKAASGQNCNITFISTIASLAYTNLETPGMLPEMRDEAKIILKSIKKHYRLKDVAGFLRVDKIDKG